MASRQLTFAVILLSLATVTVFGRGVSNEEEVAIKSLDQTKTFGKQGPMDRVLLHQRIEVKGKPSETVEGEVVYPGSKPTKGEVINYIRVIDLLKTGKNGDITITKGGVGEKVATVHAKSQKGQPIKYNVEVWGRKV